MEVTKVTSSNIDAIGYDPTQRILKIVFRSGAIYDYYDVDPEIYNSLMNATSIGKEFNSTIRNSYNYEKVGQV